MPTIFPAGVTAQGNIKVAFSSAMDRLAPSLAALTGAGALDLSCFLYGWAPAAEANKGAAPRRLCSKREFEKFGATTESIGDLQYTVDPQAAEGEDGKKAYEMLTEGTAGYLTERLGKDAQEEDFATGDFVIVRPVLFGPQIITGDPTDEFSEFTVNQPVAVQAPGAGPLVALAA